eukprot:3613558-Amphidinium_carterae.1
MSETVWASINEVTFSIVRNSSRNKLILEKTYVVKDAGNLWKITSLRKLSRSVVIFASTVRLHNDLTTQMKIP